jgi:hypothetical protein
MFSNFLEYVSASEICLTQEFPPHNRKALSFPGKMKPLSLILSVFPSLLTPHRCLCSFILTTCHRGQGVLGFVPVPSSSPNSVNLCFQSSSSAAHSSIQYSSISKCLAQQRTHKNLITSATTIIVTNKKPVSYFYVWLSLTSLRSSCSSDLTGGDWRCRKDKG